MTGGTEDLPAVSVIIPTHNRAELLRSCLEALGRQDLQKSFEVIVVLDGCVDGSANVVREAGAGLRFTLIEQKQRGPAAARNRGAREAVGATFLFIDDDITLEPGAVRAHVEAQEREGPGLVIGPIETRAKHRGLPTRSIKFWRSVRRRHESGAPPTFLDCFTGNVSMPSVAFRKAGGFNEDLRRSEDIELAFRLTEVGLPVIYAWEAAGIQEFNKTTGEVLRDAEGFGRANVTLWETHPEMRRFLHMGGVTSGIGLRSEVLSWLARLPFPMTAFRGLGAISDSVPGTDIFATWAQAYWRVRGVRSVASEPASWRQMTAKLRILRYAAFELPGRVPGGVSKRSFERQLTWLKGKDIEVTTLERHLARLGSDSPPQNDTVIVTLDAPLEQIREVALPALKSAGLTATAFVDQRDSRVATAESAVAGYAVEVGLRGPPGTMATARASAERDVVAFAYPPGRPSSADIASIRAAGFKVACAARPGPTGWRTNPFLLPRMTVASDTSMLEFKWMVRFGQPAPWRRGGRR